MHLHAIEPPYYWRESGAVKLPNPSDEEAQAFLRAAVRACFRETMKSGWRLRDCMDEGDLPMKVTGDASPDYVSMGEVDIKNITTQQYAKILTRCAEAMHEQVAMSAVWNPVLLKAVRSLKGKFSAAWIAFQVRDLFSPGRDGRSAQKSIRLEVTRLQKSEDIWERVGNELGIRLQKGAVERMRVRGPRSTAAAGLKVLIERGLKPEVIGMVTPEVAARFCPSCAKEMTRKGIRAVTPETFAKALDVELDGDLKLAAKLHDALKSLSARDQEFAKAEGGGGMAAIRGWAKRMRREGGKHPFTWCQKTASKHGLGDAFCARVHMEAFGRTPSEKPTKGVISKRTAAKAMSEFAPLTDEGLREDFVHRNFPVDW